MIAETKTCLCCSKHIRGRSDKKFCNYYCRNTYNNQCKRKNSVYLRNINIHLRKNRKILEGFMGSSKNTAKTTKRKLQLKGFRFTYFTHTYTNRKGKIFLFCYEYGYLVMEKENVMVIRKERTEEEDDL